MDDLIAKELQTLNGLIANFIVLIYKPGSDDSYVAISNVKQYLRKGVTNDSNRN